MPLDFNKIRAVAVENFESLLTSWLPNGKRDGIKYVAHCPFHTEKTPSFKADLREGYWLCFGCNSKGGDPISLYAAMNQVNQGVAARKLAEHFRIPIESSPVPYKPTHKPAPSKAVAAKQKLWTPLPHTDEPLPPIRHPRHGVPVKVYLWQTSDSRTAGATCRFEFPDGSKQVLPFAFCTFTGDNGALAHPDQWRWNGLATPRPLWNLPQLAANPARGVFVVEGEKTAEAAQRLLGANAVVTTWSGGCKAVAQTDWTPLVGRKVVIWPDADEPGVGVAMWIQKFVGNLNANANLPQPPPLPLVVRPPDGVKPGWDLADAEAEGWNLAKVVQQVKLSKANPLTPPVVTVASATSEASSEASFAEPFKPLGHDRQRYFYLSRGTKQVIELGASEHKKLQLLQLAPADYWIRMFDSGDGSPDYGAAANYLLQSCIKSGIFSEQRIRGRGCWLDDGRIVYHLGDRLLVDGSETHISGIDSDFVYEAGPRIPMAAAEPASIERAVEFAALIELLPVREPLYAVLLAGWCFTAPICGCLPWRSHVWLTGPASSGKTWTVENVVTPILGPNVIYVQSATTEAGVRQTVGRASLPVVMDESESEERRSAQRVQIILELARAASAESGASIVKGTTHGVAMQFNVHCSFLFASIGYAAQQRADVSRITQLEFASREDADGTKFDAVKAQWAATVGQPGFSDALRARAIRMAKSIRISAQNFAQVLSAILGNRRAGDQLGTMFAGAYCLGSDSAATLEAARRFVEVYKPELALFKPTVTDMDENRALNVLLDAQFRLESDRYASTLSVSELVGIARGMSAQADDARRALMRNGILVNHESIVVSGSHTSLADVYEGTPWHAKWRDQLGRISGSTFVPAQRFGGSTHRAVIVPFKS